MITKKYDGWITASFASRNELPDYNNDVKEGLVKYKNILLWL